MNRALPLLTKEQEQTARGIMRDVGYERIYNDKRRTRRMIKFFGLTKNLTLLRAATHVLDENDISYEMRVGRYGYQSLVVHVPLVREQ